MRNFKKIILITLLLVLLIYVTAITSIPKTIVLMQGEEFKLAKLFGIYINKEKELYKTVQTFSNIKNSNVVQKQTYKVSLLNLIDLRKVEVNTIPKTTVVPLGNSVGLKLYTSGVLVVGKTQIEGKKPYEKSGIEEGDIIVKINENEITCTAELIENVNSSEGNNLNIKYIRDGVERTGNIEPVKTKEDEYKIGLWVRDGAAGVGTISYYEPSTGYFAALGHGILDIDTEELIKISSGELVTTRISSITKGEKGIPGEIKGSIINSSTIGEISINSDFGVYGKISNTYPLNINTNNEIEVANRDEIHEGNAKILLNLENGIRKEYDIEIERIYKNNNYNNKSMQIKVTDQELLNLTGGIVQRNEWSSNNTKR